MTQFQRKSSSVSDQGLSHVAITPSDTVDLHQIAKAIYVGGAGDISAVSANGETVILKAVPAGTQYVASQIRRVNATGTTATDIVGVFEGGVPFILGDIPGAALHFDFSRPDTMTFAGSTILTVSNLVSGGPALGQQAGLSPDWVEYSSKHGRSCAEWGDVLSKKGFNLPATVAVKDIFVVLSYFDGIKDKFDTFTTIFTDLTSPSNAGGSPNHVRGSTGLPTLHNSSGSGNVAKNRGSIGLNPVLPTGPLCLLHFNTPNFPLGSIGGASFGSTRGWQGSMCEVLAFTTATTLTPDTILRIKDHLIGKWGIRV